MYTSDFADFFKAYSAVHNQNLREELEDERDEISDMDLSLFSEQDLSDIVEEVLEELFNDGYDVEDVDLIFEEALFEANQYMSAMMKGQNKYRRQQRRQEKIDKIKGAVKGAMDKVKEKASRGAVKAYSKYRSAKQSAQDTARRTGQSIKNKSAQAAREYANKKGEVKKGIKGMVKRAAERVASGATKVAKRMSENIEYIDEKLRSREERMARMMTDKDRQKQKKERKLKAKADEIISTERALSKGRKKNSEKTFNTPDAEVRKLKPGQKKDTLAMRAMEEYEIDEKLNLKKADMGDVVKDFYKSDAPQFKGRSKEERRKMAIAAKLTAERGGRKLGEAKVEPPKEKLKTDRNMFNISKDERDAARERILAKARAKRKVEESQTPQDKAFSNVVAMIKAKEGKGAIYDPKAPKPKRSQRKPVDSRTNREKETQGRYLGGGRYAGD